MVEIHPWWNPDVKMYGFDYKQGFKAENKHSLTMIMIRPRESRSVMENKYVVKDVLQKNNQHDVKERSDEPCKLIAKWKHKKTSEDQRLKNIFQMCLSPDDRGERLSLISPKNFVVQYFTVSRNQPVKVCCESQCTFAGRDLRSQESKLKPACPEFPRCKRSRTESPKCSNPPNEIRDLEDSAPCNNSSKKKCDSRKDDGRACSSSRRGCSSLRPKKNTSQQTEPELSWQEKCSNFITKLPVTFSDKLFGPRIICDESNDSKRNIFDGNSKLNRSQPVPKDSAKLGSTDQGNKKSVKSQASPPTNQGCHKNIGTDRVCLENVSQIDPCHSRAFHSALQADVVPCGRSGLGSENYKVTRKKITTKCLKSCRDSFPPLKNTANGIQSGESDQLEPRFECGAKKSATSPYPEESKQDTRSSSFSNWPAILSEKFFGPRDEKVANDEVIDAKTRNGVEDSPGIVCVAGSPSAEKKERLLLKKYTISQSPEAMEETLCFNVVDKEQVCETRTKLRSKVCVKFTSDNQGKLDTVQKQYATGKCSETVRSHTSKRSVKSKANSSRSSSRKIQQFEKKTSTEHIFLSNLIMKLLNRHKDDKDAINGKKCNRKMASGKYATTSIHKYKNRPMKSSRYAVEGGQNNGAASCSLEKKVSLDRCADPDVANAAGKDQIQREIASDYSSGKREVPEAPENLENTRDLSKKVTHIMRHDCTGRSEDASSNLQEEYQDCDSHGSSKAKDLVKSGVLQVIDKNRRREARGLRSLHGKKREPKFAVREKIVKRISSPNKFACRVRRQNQIENDDSHLESRGCFDRDLSERQKGTTETGICGLRHWDKSEMSTPENCNIIISHREKNPGIQCRSEQSTVGKACERLIVKNGISDPAMDRSVKLLGEGPRRTFVIAGENICIKMLYDRETFTDDENPGQQIPPARCTPDKKVEKVKNCSSLSKKPGQSGISKAPRTLSQGERIRPEQNGKGNMQKQLKNGVEIRVGCEECVGLLWEDNVCRVRPEGISKDDDVSGIEPGMGKVFSPLCQEASNKRENKVFGSETCLCKDSVESETKKALLQSYSKDDECSSPSVAANSYSSEGQSDSKKEGANDHRQSLSRYPDQIERLDELVSNIDELEKMGSWEKSSGKDLRVTKPESRNIINSYYSHGRSDAFPRYEVRNDEQGKVKKGKVQRGGGAADTSITKARKPLQQIVNVRQVGRTAKAAIKNDRGKKRVVEKENSVINKKASSNQDGGAFANEIKDYFVQNVAIDNSTLPNGSIDIPTRGHTSPIQELENTDSVPTARTKPSKIPRKSGPLTKIKTPIRASYSAAKAPESQSGKLKESIRRNWLKKGNSRAAGSKTDLKETGGEAGKMEASESSNRVTGSIDTCDTKGSETHKELQAPAYIFNKENVKARTWQIETSRIDKKNVQNGGIVKGTSEAAGERESSKSGKSPSHQRDGERDEEGRSRNARGDKKKKENMRTKENQSKSKTASEKNEKDKKSTPLKLLSQNDSAEIDASGSTQGRGTTNADLFDTALMDGKNNIQSYSDLQSADKGYSNANRISAPKDERLRKSRTVMAQSKPKLFRPSKSRGLLNSEESGSKTIKTFNIAGKDTNKNTGTSLVDAQNRDSGEGLKVDAEVNETNVTRDSLSIGANGADMGSHTTCRNNESCQRNVELRPTKKVEEPDLLTCKNDLRQTSIALTTRNSEKSCSAQRTENRVPANNIAAQQSSVCTHERLSCRFRVPTHCTNYGTPASSSRASSNFNKKRKQGACRDFDLPRKSPPYKSRGDKDAVKSNCGGKSTKDMKNIEQQEIKCREEEEETDNDSGEVITDYRVPNVNCKKSVNPRCNGTVSRVLCKGISNVEKEIVQHQYDDVPEKVTTFCGSGRSDESTGRNFSFTDDLKRLLDQGQDLFAIKKRGNCADCQKLNYEERASNSSISSLQKAYNALKTMLNKTKNIHKGLMYTKQTKGTQIYPHALDESSVLVKHCVKSRKSGKSLGLKTSDGSESLILSISIGSSILSNSSSPNCNERHS